MRKLPEVITIEEFMKVLKATKKKSHKLAYMLGFFQGLRISEIVGLKREVSACCRANIRTEGKPMKYICSQCNKELAMKDFRRGDVWKIKPLEKDNFDFQGN